nr:unnamed protein product [Callosobruchus chinensis]
MPNEFCLCMETKKIDEKAKDIDYKDESTNTTLTSYDIEILSNIEQSNEIRALELKNTELTATVSRLESIIQTHIEEEKDTLSAETQTEETVSSMVEKDEELKLCKEHVCRQAQKRRQRP